MSLTQWDRFTHFPVDEHLGNFQLGAVISSATVNLQVHILFHKRVCPLLVARCPGITRSPLGMFSFTRYCQKILTNLHSHQQ